MNASFNSSRTVLKQCPDTPTATAMTAIMVFTGIIGNSLVIQFVRRDLKRRKTPDKVLLLILSVNNTLGCCVSLPLQYFDVVHVGKIPLSLVLCSALCFIKLFVLFFCMGVGHVTLAVLSYERYEAITKFPQQRLLLYHKSIQIACIIVATFFVLTLAVMSPYIINLMAGRTLCEGLFIRTDAFENALNSSVNIAMITKTVIVLTVSNTLCFTWLFLVDHKLRNHLQSVRNTLGNQTTVKEIRMVRSAFAFILTYTFIWIPFGVARGLRNTLPDSTSIHCYYLTAFIVSYLTFSIVPYLYMFFDKRIKNPLAYFRNRRVAPAAESTGSGTASTTTSKTAQGRRSEKSEPTFLNAQDNVTRPHVKPLNVNTSSNETATLAS